MVKLTDHKVVLRKKWELEAAGGEKIRDGRSRTMACRILNAHNQSGNEDCLRLKFDALVSPDNNYVNILQTAGASGLRRFPVPYVLSNCHHTLCAAGGTINGDDHVYGLGSAEKYGGIFVPPYCAVLHQYMREMMAGCGKMIMGSDSHSRYGALGTLGIGEGGGEVVKQLLERTYDLSAPPVIAVRLTGSPRPGVGPQDVALSLVAAVFQNHFVKNKILEFIGPGIAGLSMEYRMGIDVMTTESGALSSIWCTDEKTRGYLAEHGREEDYRKMEPEEGAVYDGLIEMDLSQAECMIALPFHPSNAMPIRVFKEHAEDFLHEVEEEGRRIKGAGGKPFSVMSHIRNGEFYADQALVSGCSGGMFENITAMADILKGYGICGTGISLGINPASLPVMTDLMKQGIGAELSVAGAVLCPCICGPCFGVTDVPADNQLSIRHVTRNYSNREGSKPDQGQMAAVCLMDARSIAATVRNGGRITAATELKVEYRNLHHHFDRRIYENQVFRNYGKGDSGKSLIMGPNIADWPEFYAPAEYLLLKAAGVYKGSVTTDELVPSGEISSLRSNPEKISQYTLIGRDREYVGRAKAVRALEAVRREQIGKGCSSAETGDRETDRLMKALRERLGCGEKDISLGSILVSEQIGDGSSREQAASCQRVLGGLADLTNEYATKRYRSNLINWGILPLRTEERLKLPVGSWILLRNVRQALEGTKEMLSAELLDPVTGETVETLSCTMDVLTAEERKILLAGCLINYYRGQKEAARVF